MHSKEYVLELEGYASKSEQAGYTKQTGYDR